MASTSERIFGLLRSLAGALLSPGKTAAPKGKAATRPGSQSATRPGIRRDNHATSHPASNTGGTGLSAPYPGDFRGEATVSYAPTPNGDADPGEIVWTWVPYEEDYSQGKDRPVLIVARNGKRLLALMLTSKDHSNDHRGDNDYVDIGTGAWDRQGRPSEVKLDRILQINPKDMRREGAVLDKQRFAGVAAALRSRHGWR